VFVKICGITNEDDALAAVEAGAQALGFIFAPNSPRFVNDQSLAPWIENVPRDVWRVGVFVNEDPRRIEAIAKTLHLDVVQLHGAEGPDELPRVLRTWKAVRVNGRSASETGLPVEAMLFDGPSSGVAFDWAGVELPRSKKVILAGGLNADNVRAAIDAVAPWGVDACSSLERSPGHKDHAKVEKFIQAALAC
jgi:phosphoribosylanthranilate isomerase